MTGMMLRMLARLQVRYEVHVRDARREAARREDAAEAGGPVPVDHPALRPQGPPRPGDGASAPHSASVPRHPDQHDRRVVPLSRVPRRRAEMDDVS